MLSRYIIWLGVSIAFCGGGHALQAGSSNKHAVQVRGLNELELDALIQKCDTTTTAKGTQALKRLTVPCVKLSDVRQRQELLAYFIKESEKRAEVVRALENISQHDSSAQRYDQQVIDELFVSSRPLYQSFIPVNLDNSPICLTALHWLGLVGSPVLSVFCELLERSNVDRAHRIRWIGANDVPRQEPMSLLSYIKASLGIAHLGSKLNFIHAPQVGTAAQINRAAHDAAWRNQAIDDSNATSADCTNALMAAFALEYYRDQYPEDDVQTIFEQRLNLGPEESITERFKKDDLKQYRKSLLSAISYKNPVYALLKIIGIGMMANDTRLRIQGNVRLEHALWEHVTVLSQWAASVEQLATTIAREAFFWREAKLLLDVMRDETVHRFFAAARSFNAGITKELRWVHNPGQVLYVHRCAEKAAEKIGQILECIGSIDAWMSMVHAVQRYDLCEARFMQSDHATVCADQLWSILVNRERAVKNDVILDRKSNKMLITGPNGGGKSTVMKAVGQAVLLAQSWGFVPAESFVCTPFHTIFVAMDSQQSVSAGLSTYMSELHTLNQITLTAQTQKGHGRHCLVLLDEPCRGSIEVESAGRITGFCSDIDAYENVVALMATHLYSPALHAEQFTTWANYQLGYVFEDERVRRTFTLLPGIAHWWFTDAEQRTQFLDYLSQGVLAHSLASEHTLFSRATN